MSNYELCSHAEVGDHKQLCRSLARLNRLTFSHYDGVIVPSPEFMEWYSSRPGMDPKLCQAAFAGEELVSSVAVTLAHMRVAGRMVLCGIVDEVMTHPEHRRQGLAKALLERATAAMRSSGAQVSLLYTAQADPPAGPQRLYETLGYRPHELVDRWVKRPPHIVVPGVSMIRPDGEARAAFAAALGGRDGWLELDDALWRWRRLERPARYPVTLYRASDGALAAVCPGQLLIAGQPMAVTVISDLVLRSAIGSLPRKAARALGQIMSAASVDAPVTILCPRSDAPLRSLLHHSEFEALGTEIAMLRHLGSQNGLAVGKSASGWYVAVESVIGV